MAVGSVPLADVAQRLCSRDRRGESVGVVCVAMLLWLIVALVSHPRFQFSIRSLLILTVAVALPCSWLSGGDEGGKGAGRDNEGD